MKFLKEQSLLQQMWLGFIQVFHMMEASNGGWRQGGKDKIAPTEDIIIMLNFVVKNNLLEFDCKFYQQISGTAIGTKFALLYACIFIDYIERKFLRT